MKPIKDLFGDYKIPPKTRITERGELLRYFANELNKLVKGMRGYNESRVAYFVSHLNVKDLYFLKSDCEQAQKRGVPFGAAFWHALDIQFPKKDNPFVKKR
ncbi:MAG: hypothetical protein AAB706_01480 [Patescibacteria group bacterium]